MKIQILNLSFKNVLERYQEKYRDLIRSAEEMNLALEVRNFKAEGLQTLISVFHNKCQYYIHRKSLSADILIPGEPDLIRKIVWESENGDPFLKASIIRHLEAFTSRITDSLEMFEPAVSFRRPLIMGILNVTPDSFSDAGNFYTLEDAMKHAAEMIEAGADIIDIGGESTRPGSEFVPEEEEKKRVIPVIEQLREKYPDTILSIDSTKKNVIRQALSLGVKIVNDISGLTFDPLIADIAAEFNAALVIMHIKGTPKTMQKEPVYDDVTGEIYDFFTNQIGIAEKAGVKNIILDPGIGFGKRVIDNYEIIQRLHEFRALGYPVLTGVSRKSFLGKSLGLSIDDRDTATVIAETLAVQNGADIIRTHNIRNAVQMKNIAGFCQNPELVKENV